MHVEEILRTSERLLVITGAGCSTASGIGDYRDDSGAWKHVQPVQHHDFMNSEHWRQRYWARSQAGFGQFIRARPNEAHHVLARWESAGRVLGLITQNVDRLHQRAGHRNVIDLHGRLDQVLCMGCGRIGSRQHLQGWLEAHNQAPDAAGLKPAPDGDAELHDYDYGAVDVPYCQDCGGILKPHVVFFGDSVPRARVEQAYSWVEQADALLVVGSSLMVFSGFRFVRQAHARGIPVVAVNRGRTRADDMLTAKLSQDCGPALARLSMRLDW